MPAGGEGFGEKNRRIVAVLPADGFPMSDGVKIPDARAAAFTRCSPSPCLLFTDQVRVCSALSVKPVAGLRRSCTSTDDFV